MKTIPLAFAALTLLVPLAAAPAVAQNAPAPVPALLPVDGTVLPIPEPTFRGSGIKCRSTSLASACSSRVLPFAPTLGMLVGMSLK